MDTVGTAPLRLSEDDFGEAMQLLAQILRAGAPPQRANAVVALGLLFESAPSDERRREVLRALVGAAARVAEPGEDAGAVLDAAIAELSLLPPPWDVEAREAAVTLSRSVAPQVDGGAALNLSLALAAAQGTGQRGRGLGWFVMATRASASRFLRCWKQWNLPLGAASAGLALLVPGLLLLAGGGLVGHGFTILPDAVAAFGLALASAFAAGLVAVPPSALPGRTARLAEAVKVTLAVSAGCFLLIMAILLAGANASSVEFKHTLALLAVAAPGVLVMRLASFAVPVAGAPLAAFLARMAGPGGAGVLAALLVALALAWLGTGEAYVSPNAGPPPFHTLHLDYLPAMTYAAAVIIVAAAAGCAWSDRLPTTLLGPATRPGRVAFSATWTAAFCCVGLLVWLGSRIPPAEQQASVMLSSRLVNVMQAAPDCAAQQPEVVFTNVALGEYRRLPICPGRPAELVTSPAATDGGREPDLELYVVDEQLVQILHQDDPNPPVLSASARDLGRAGPLFFCLQLYNTGLCTLDAAAVKLWSASAIANAALVHATHSGLRVTAQSLAAGASAGASEASEATRGGYTITLRVQPARGGGAAPATPAARPGR